MRILMRFFALLGGLTFNFFYHLGAIVRLSAEAFYWLLVSPFGKKQVKPKHIFKQTDLLGVNSLSIASLVGFFFGITLAMLTSYQLKKLGSEILVAGLVGVSFTRELGPLLTAVVVAARVGAGIAAEIGTMKVSEEIDALETMAIRPVRYLIAPRLLAVLITLPALVVLVNVIGMLGGFIIGFFSLHINPLQYLSLTFEALERKDIVVGLVKSLFFAYIIAIIGCYQGLTVKGGAEGVGVATTKAVVLSIQTLIVCDCILNAYFYF